MFKNIMSILFLLLFLIGCTNYPDVNIKIDEYVIMELLTKDDANETYTSALNRGLYGNFDLYRFGSRVPCYDGNTNISCASLVDTNYYNALTASEDYYLKINFYTNVSLAYVGEENLWKRIVSTVFFKNSQINFSGYSSIQFEEKQNSGNYLQTILISVALAKGTNLYTDLSQENKDKRVLFPSELVDMALEIDEYSYPSYFDGVHYTSNRVVIPAGNIQAVLDQMP